MIPRNSQGVQTQPQAAQAMKKGMHAGGHRYSMEAGGGGDLKELGGQMVLGFYEPEEVFL